MHSKHENGMTASHLWVTFLLYWDHYPYHILSLLLFAVFFSYVIYYLTVTLMFLCMAHLSYRWSQNYKLVCVVTDISHNPSFTNCTIQNKKKMEKLMEFDYRIKPKKETNRRIQSFSFNTMD